MALTGLFAFICLIAFLIVICRTADAGPKLAIKANFMLNTGSFGSPTWSNVTLVGDASVPFEWTEGDGSTRGSRLEMSVKTMLKVGFQAKVRTDDTDANFQTIWNAAQNDTILNVLILDGPLTVAGPRGYWLDTQVFSNSQDQALKGVLFNEFNFKPTPTANQQAYVTVGATSTLTSTAIGS